MASQQGTSSMANPIVNPMNPMNPINPMNEDDEPFDINSFFVTPITNEQQRVNNPEVPVVAVPMAVVPIAPVPVAPVSIAPKVSIVSVRKVQKSYSARSSIESRPSSSASTRSLPSMPSGSRQAAKKSQTLKRTTSQTDRPKSLGAIGAAVAAQRGYAAAAQKTSANISEPKTDTALLALTRSFIEATQPKQKKVTDLNAIASLLKVPKRRFYDIINVLVGVGAMRKVGRSCVQWLKSGFMTEYVNELKKSQELLIAEEPKIDELIEESRKLLKMAYEDPATSPYAYIRQADVTKISDQTNSISIVVKSAADLTNNVEVIVNASTDGAMQVACRHMNGSPMTAFVCKDRGEGAKSDEPPMRLPTVHVKGYSSDIPIENQSFGMQSTVVGQICQVDENNKIMQHNAPLGDSRRSVPLKVANSQRREPLESISLNTAPQNKRMRMSDVSPLQMQNDPMSFNPFGEGSSRNHATQEVPQTLPNDWECDENVQNPYEMVNTQDGAFRADADKDLMCGGDLNASFEGLDELLSPGPSNIQQRDPLDAIPLNSILQTPGKGLSNFGSPGLSEEVVNPFGEDAYDVFARMSPVREWGCEAPLTDSLTSIWQ